MIAGTLELQITMELARLRSDVSQMKALVNGAANDMTSSFGNFKSVLGALTAGLSGAMFVNLVKGAIDAQDQLRDLSLTTTLTVETLSGLRVAAKQSGTDLEGVVGAINKLAMNMGKDADKFKMLGLSAKDPLEAFKELADIYVALEDPQQRAAVMAAALGKSWQAVAPMLAEGGAKMGELISKSAALTNSTKEISDQADEFNDKLVLLTGTGGLMTSVLGQVLPLFNQLLGSLIDSKTEAKGAATEFTGILDAFKLLIVIAGNVAFVFRGVGNEIGGIVAQTAAFLGVTAKMAMNDFAGAIEAARQANFIGEELSKDGEKRRAEFDAWVASINRVGTSAQVAAAKIDAMDQVSRRAGAAERTAAAIKAEEVRQAAADFLKAEELQRKAEENARKAEAEEKKRQAFRRKANEDQLAWIKEALKEELDAREKAAKEAERLLEKARAERERETKRWIDAIEDEATAKYIQLRAIEKAEDAYFFRKIERQDELKAALKAQVEQMEFENTLIGLGNVERQKAIALRAIETSGIEAQAEATIRLADRMLAAIDSGEAKRKLAEMSDTLTGALMSAFDNAKFGIKDFIGWLKAEFAKLVLRPQVQAAVNGLFGTAGIDGSASGGATGSLLQGIGNLLGGSPSQKGYGGAGDPGGFSTLDRSLATNTMPALFERYLGVSSEMVKSIGQVAGGIAIGLGVGGALAQAIGGDQVKPLHSVIGTVVGAVIGSIWGNPMVGAAIGGAVGGVLDGILHEGPAPRTATVGSGPGNYTYGSSSRLGDVGIVSGSDKWFSDEEMGDTLTQWFRAVGRLDDAVAARFNPAEVEAASRALVGRTIDLSFGTEHTQMSPEILTRLIKDRFTTVFGVIDEQMAAIIANFDGGGEELVTLVVDLATVHQRLTELRSQLSTVFGQDVGFADIAALKGETEGYTEALQRLAGVYGVTNQIAQMLGKSQEEVWGSVGLASARAREKLVEAAGGIESLANGLDYFYTHFYTTQEQQAQKLSNFQQAFSDVGVAMPTTIDGFRAITDNFLGMGEAGAVAAAQMLAMAPAFYEYIKDIEAVETAILESGDHMASVFGEALTLDDVRSFQENGELLSDTLTRVTTEFEATNRLLKMFGLDSTVVFGAFGLASKEAREDLIRLTGGLEAFGASLDFFYQNFFTEAERLAMEGANVNSVFADLGIAVPSSAKEFRDLVSLFLLMGPAGAETVAALLGVAPAFLSVTRAATQAFDRNAPVVGPRPGEGRTRESFADERQAALDEAAAKLDEVMSKAGISIASLSDIIRDGLLGKLSGSEVGEQMGDILVDGIKQGMAAQTADAVMDVIKTNLMDPIMLAILNGSSVTAAMNLVLTEANIQLIIGKATAFVTALNAVFKDPAFIASLATLRTTISGVAAGIVTSVNTVATSMNQLGFDWPAYYEKLKKDQEAAAEKAAREKAEAAAAAAQLLNDKLEMQARIYDLLGDKVNAALVLEQQRAIALAKLHPELQALQTQLWGLEDAAKAAAKATEFANTKRGLEIQLQRALGNEEVALAMEREDTINALIAQWGDGATELIALYQQIWTEEDKQKLANGLNSWKKQISDWLNGSLLDSNLSPLTAQQQLAEAKRQYDADLLLAKSGDAAAIARLTKEADTLLELKKSVEGFGGGYTAMFESIRSDLSSLIAPTALMQPTVGESQIVSNIIELRTDALETREVLARLLERLNEKMDEQTAAVSGAVVEGADQTSSAVTTAYAVNERR